MALGVSLSLRGTVRRRAFSLVLTPVRYMAVICRLGRPVGDFFAYKGGSNAKGKRVMRAIKIPVSERSLRLRRVLGLGCPDVAFPAAAAFVRLPRQSVVDSMLLSCMWMFKFQRFMTAGTEPGIHADLPWPRSKFVLPVARPALA